jgi:peptidoglycan/xylan/chitin deacetylase (PgdA/CDA1 family)
VTVSGERSPGIRRWEPQWPGGARCAVMLSFDVDGITLWSDRDKEPDPCGIGRARSLGDYGVLTGLPRILDLLRRTAVPATFFVPGYIAENWSNQVSGIVADGHELGLHGYLHETFHGLTDAEQIGILSRAQEVFFRRFGVTARGFRAPSGDWAASTPRVLREFGLEYSSSFRGDDRPFMWTFDDGPAGLVEIPGHWELDDFPQFAYNDWPAAPASQDRPSPAAQTFSNWTLEFDGYHREGLCYVLMMHPQVMGTPHRLARLEQLISHMRDRGDVWFATGGQIAEWCRASMNAGASA